jgi:hypothetical protein
MGAEDRIDPAMREAAVVVHQEWKSALRRRRIANGILRGFRDLRRDDEAIASGRIEVLAAMPFIGWIPDLDNHRPVVGCGITKLNRADTNRGRSAFEWVIGSLCARHVVSFVEARAAGGRATVVPPR